MRLGSTTVVRGRAYNPPVCLEEWVPPAVLREATETDRRRARAFAAGAEVRQDRAKLEAAAASALTERLERLKRELQASIVGASDFRRFQIERLLADVDRMLAEARADILRLARRDYERAGELGGSQVDAAVRGAQIDLTTPVGLSPTLVSQAFDNTADLLTEPMQRFRAGVATTVRRIALNADSFGGGMARLAREIDDTGMAAAAFKAERIVRTELGRTFNGATFDRMLALSARIPAMRKIWLRANDARTRPTHVAAAATYARGQGIPIGEPFRVGAARMRFPVDPLAEPAGKVAARETIMCRCNAVVDFDPAALEQMATERLALTLGRGHPPPVPTPTPKPKAAPKPKAPKTADDAFRALVKADSKYRPAIAEKRRAEAPLVSRETDLYSRRRRIETNQIPEFANDPALRSAAFQVTQRELLEVRAELEKVRVEIEKLETAWKKANLKAVAVDKANRGKLTIRFHARDGFTKIEKKRYTEAIRDFELLVGTRTMGKGPGFVGYHGGVVEVRRARDANGQIKSRSFAQPFAGEIHMGTLDKGVVVHELGHLLDRNQELAKTVAFLGRRAGTETTRKLADLTGIASYDPGEVAWKDKFADEYMGKLYAYRNVGPGKQFGDYAASDFHATEILSMGIERLYRNPLGFAREDPEYFKFIFDLLRGQ